VLNGNSLLAFEIMHSAALIAFTLKVHACMLLCEQHSDAISDELI